MALLGGSYALRSSDLIESLDLSKLKLQRNNGDKKNLLKSITDDFMYLVLDDLINKGVLFRFSTPTEAYIQVEGIYDDEFIKARKEGAFYEVDPLMSNNCGHLLMMSYKKGKRIFKDRIVVDTFRKNIITEKTNNGFKY